MLTPARQASAERINEITEDGTRAVTGETIVERLTDDDEGRKLVIALAGELVSEALAQGFQSIADALKPKPVEGG